jgi:excisionase family DNA binding protein
MKKELPPLLSPLDRRRFLTVRQVAALTEDSPSKVRDMARMGEIPGAFQTRKGGKWKFDRVLLEPWLTKIRTQIIAT